MGSLPTGSDFTGFVPETPPYTPPEVPVPEETVPTTVRQVVDFPREADIMVGDVLTDSGMALWEAVTVAAATTGENTIVTRVQLVAQDMSNTDTPIAEGEILGARSSETNWLTARSWTVAAGTLGAGRNWLADTLLDTFSDETEGNTQMRMIVRTADNTSLGAGTARLRGHIIYDRSRSRMVNTVFYPQMFRVTADAPRGSIAELAQHIGQQAGSITRSRLVQLRAEISSGVREVVMWDGEGLRLEDEHLMLYFPNQGATEFQGLLDTDPEGSGFFDYSVHDVCLNKESIFPMLEEIRGGDVSVFLTRTPLTIPEGQRVTLAVTLRPRQAL